MNSPLLAIATIATVGWIATAYVLLRKELRQRQAWQWWHTHQVAESHNCAESVRNGLLQQTFAFRRYLEHQLNGQPKSDSTSGSPEYWLNEFQSFHQSLEHLSNQLSPPFMEDSLPLALQFLLKDCQRSRPDLQLQLNMPAEWPHHDVNQNRLILSLVEALVTLYSKYQADPQRLQLKLSSQGKQHALTLYLDSSALSSEQRQVQLLSQSPEAQHIKEVFRNLAAGKLQITCEGAGLRGQFVWHS